MRQKTTKHHLRMVNPSKGAELLIKGLSKEFVLTIEEYWEKKEDGNLILHTKPLNEYQFNHFIIATSENKSYIDFSKYLLRRMKLVINKLKVCITK